MYLCLCMQQGEQGRGALLEQRVVLPGDSNAQYGRPTVIRAHWSSWPDCWKSGIMSWVSCRPGALVMDLSLIDAHHDGGLQLAPAGTLPAGSAGSTQHTAHSPQPTAAAAAAALAVPYRLCLVLYQRLVCKDGRPPMVCQTESVVSCTCARGLIAIAVHLCSLSLHSPDCCVDGKICGDMGQPCPAKHLNGGMYGLGVKETALRELAHHTTSRLSPGFQNPGAHIQQGQHPNRRGLGR